MKMDFNQLERAAEALVAKSDFEGAAEIYYFMADGDASLDAGYLGYKIGICYERGGKMLAAAYWYGRAAEENPVIEKYRDARSRFSEVDTIEFLKKRL